MPMQLTISRNRKQSENYNSQGYGVSLTIELDQSLLTRPDDLQHAIDELYHEADAALERQASGSAQQQREPATNGRGHDRNTRAESPKQRHATSNNRSTRTSGNTSGARKTSGSSGAGGMTQSQRRAIRAICQRLEIDPREEARHEFGLDIERMSVREASAMIDHLKSLQSSRQNGG